MFETMYSVDGIGLAANQIGISKQVFVFDCPDGFGNWHQGYMINPIRASVSVDEPEDSEGCLSIPGVYMEFPRASRVLVRGLDLRGSEIEIEGNGYFARCLLHETQHLDGKLFINILKGAQRKQAMKMIRELILAGKL